MLRKRLPPFEELRLDEEVATYTSMCVSAATGFLPPRSRCGNPLATMLHFEESSVSTLLPDMCRNKNSLQSEIINIYLLNLCKNAIPPKKKVYSLKVKAALNLKKRCIMDVLKMY